MQDVDQRMYDFLVVEKVMESLGGCDDDGPALWEQALVDIDTFGVSDVLTPMPGIVKRVLATVAAMDRPHMLQRFQEYAQAVLTEPDFQRIVEVSQINYDFGVLKDAAVVPPTVAELEEWHTAVLAGVPLGRQPSVSVIQFVIDFCQSRNRPHLLARFGAMLDLLIADGQVLDSGSPVPPPAIGDGIDPLLLLP